MLFRSDESSAGSPQINLLCPEQPVEVTVSQASTQPEAGKLTRKIPLLDMSNCTHAVEGLGSALVSHCGSTWPVGDSVGGRPAVGHPVKSYLFSRLEPLSTWCNLQPSA